MAAGALLGAASLLLAGCTAGSSGPDENAEKPQQLRVLYGDASAGDEAIASLVPGFKEAYGVDLEIDNMPYDALQQKVFSEFASASDYYDIVIVDTPWAPALVQSLEPLGSYLSNDALNKNAPESDLGDFIPKVFYDTAVYKADSPTERFDDAESAPDIGSITDSGFDVFGLPIQANVATMAYRADLFEDPAQQAAFAAEYGRPLAVPTTWEDFADVAEFFTQPDKGLYGTTIMAGVGDWATDDFKTLLASFGGDGTLVNPDGEQTFDTPEGVDALTYYADLAQSGNVPPGSTSADWGTTADSFASGLTAMTWNYSPMALSPTVSDAGGRIGYAPMPGQQAEGPHFGTWMLSINPNSKNKEWAYQAISWMTASEQQTAMTELQMHPSRVSAYESVTSDNPEAAFYETLGDSLAQGVGRARVPNYTEISHEIAVAVNDAATGASTPEEALSSAADRVQSLLGAGN
ncbi:sugar ABC transporter substrate-binding protein [Herbiconiux sp. CPCC 205763]|uniref:Sugar ABC transporter substrate-binding protein n=1 Tax=Herbiconiux aconitum TaxID=2970913 RepID=A0ABT2GPQ9_9MICO|nr:sugar ABC transporter substrate-binding protein [Herbiconiux aconitum]MCS5716914.1 sugar ABC transporter substrate-binding protein [Herbiconiux aconitum]